MNKKEIEHQRNETARALVAELNPDGFWEGKLSSSALGVAVAVAALHFDDPETNAAWIHKGLGWLKQNINADGSYGDTPESQGNVSTSLLVYAALNLYGPEDPSVKATQSEIASYLGRKNIDVHSSQVSEYILNHYQSDYTFSVPILTMCALCGIPDKNAFRHIPQLPFELSLMPGRIYRLLNLSVVSYAIPALVAVGIVIFKNKKSSLFWRLIRKFSIPPALRILHRMLPESGGYLEAIPLTAFVALSLIHSGYHNTEAVGKGISFLKKTQREDGGWPIDVDLSTWVTSLSIKAFRNHVQDFLESGQRDQIASHLLNIQNKSIHPFNGTAPGGWGWTYFSGSVPDGDDTPGAILALLKLQERHKIKDAVLAGASWLKDLQNSDGGFPTFSRGWGKLPFDKSCADLTGHCLLAVSALLETYRDELEKQNITVLEKIFHGAVKYLQNHQAQNGSWLPLWFGNQLTGDHTNPVYGTARVLTYLKDALAHDWITGKVRTSMEGMAEKAQRYLVSVQNDDGSWGGGKNIPGTIEETALAVSALAAPENRDICLNGITWLDSCIRENGFQSAPIGLYFASLWYDEKLYPLTAYLEALIRSLSVDLFPVINWNTFNDSKQKDFN